MLGRGNAKKKRFELGIKSMEYIMKEAEGYNLNIISNLTGINHLKTLVYNLKLENNVNFLGYSSTPEIYFKNASLNFFPSISESFGLVLCETKIYGIPNILLGLDYLSISKEGTVIIYDDTPESLSKEAMKILNNQQKKKTFGIEGRKSIKKFDNNELFSKWVKLILSIFNGDNYYKDLIEKNEIINKNEIFNILNNQIKLLRMRIFKFKNITLNNYENYTFMESIKLMI